MEEDDEIRYKGTENWKKLCKLKSRKWKGLTINKENLYHITNETTEDESALVLRSFESLHKIYYV